MVTVRTHEPAERRREQVRRLTREGKSAPEIAAILGVSARTVARHRVATGCAKGRPGDPMTPDEISRARQLLADGCSRKEVARTLGRDPKTINRHFPGCGWSKSESGRYAVFMRRMAERADRLWVA